MPELVPKGDLAATLYSCGNATLTSVNVWLYSSVVLSPVTVPVACWNVTTNCGAVSRRHVDLAYSAKSSALYVHLGVKLSVV